MIRTLRWLRFNFVGLIGMVVQLGTLRILQPRTAHYLLASAVALELTIVHNFIWHTRFTWKGRCTVKAGPVRFFRFQMSNGAVSLLGALLFVRLLTGYGRLPLLLSNLISIAVCSVLNFWLADLWAFSTRPRQVITQM